MNDDASDSALPFVLTPEEARVFGCLLEKEMATPEYYPMTLNGLTQACNQKSNRRPVMDLAPETVRAALDSLREKKLAMIVSVADSRVPKFKRVTDILGDPEPAERAILCELLVRGPQTAGELRTRCDRLRPFAGIDEVEKFLKLLAETPPGPLVRKLPRQPGHKECRYVQLLTGAADDAETGDGAAPAVSAAPAPGPAPQARIEALEQEVAALRSELEALRSALDEFRRQFE